MWAAKANAQPRQRVAPAHLQVLQRQQGETGGGNPRPGDRPPPRRLVQHQGPEQRREPTDSPVMKPALEAVVYCSPTVWKP